MRLMPLVLLAAVIAWCSAVAAAGHPGGTAPPPRWLSETGLYVPGSLRIDPRNRAFVPQYPLWSDGASKARWMYLPAGASIDVSDVDRWEFPVGTRFWKEFTFDGRKVETRMLWRSTAASWTFATYVWNEAQTDAERGPDEGLPALVEVAPGRRHSIPGIADCRACHDSDRTEVLGFTALQLSTDRDPLAPHAEPLPDGAVTLRTLADDGVLAGHDVARLVSDPPRIRATNPVTRAALGYLSTNCGSCHNTRSTLSELGLVLRQPARGPVWTDAEVATLLERTTKWQQPGGASPRTLALRPGVPEHSAIVYRMRSRRPSSQMPPLGTVVSDQAALSLVTEWVAAMPAR